MHTKQTKKSNKQNNYDRWLRAKVQEALNDPRPLIPHTVVIARLRNLIKNRTDQSE